MPNQQEESEDGPWCDFDSFVSAWPLGTEEFGRRFVLNTVTKLEEVVRRITATPDLATVGLPSCQVAHLLLRSCFKQKAAHLDRLLPPKLTRPLAKWADDRAFTAWCELVEVQQLSWDLRVFLSIPFSGGGGGSLATAEATTEAAFLAGSIEAAARAQETGVDTFESEDF